MNFEMNTATMPSLFIGHGSPMNLIEENQLSKTLNILGQQFNPKAILAVSAHWLDRGPVVQNALEQKIIYDFYGFPEKLYQIQYAARGWSEEMVHDLKGFCGSSLQVTNRRGLDHGVWAVLHHMYPKADVPVVQLSIPHKLSKNEYFELGRALRGLRQKGILIIGSGNIVHNLKAINWKSDAPADSWAIEFDEKVADLLVYKKFEQVLDLEKTSNALYLKAHPTDEHFIPLIYCMGAAFDSDSVTFPIEFIQNGSVSMRSVLFS